MMSGIDKRNVKYVLYARKSTEASDKQVQSIDDQIRLMKARAERDGLQIVAVLHEAKSGGKPGTRPEFANMISMLEGGEANGILAWKLDRISRNPLDSGYVHQMMNDGKIAWILTDGRDYCEDDDVIFDVESSMDARYRKDLMKNVRRGMFSKAEKGWKPGMAPTGYLNDRVNRTIILDPVNGPLVQKVFERWLTGTVSLAGLLRYTVDLGIRTPRRRERGGNYLTLNGLRSLLRNPFYTGKFKYGGRLYNGNHPALISDEQYDRAQQLLGGLHNTRPQKDELQFITKGMLRCAKCGYAVVVERTIKKYKNGTSKEYVYCHCSGKCKTIRCDQRNLMIPEHEALRQIGEEISKYTIDPDFYNLAIEALAEEEQKQIDKRDSRLKELRKEQDRWRSELDGLRRMRYRGELTDQVWFLEESKRIQSAIENLEKNIRAADTAFKDWRKYADQVFMFARYAKEDFDSGDPERMQYVMEALGTKLELLDRTVIFTPIKYLIPIKKAVSEMASNSETARTLTVQGSKDRFVLNSELWWSI